MALREQFEASGNWLFRWRSYLPLLLLAVVLLSVGLGRSNDAGRTRRLDLAWEGMCFGLALLGLGVRVATIGFVPHGTSGRNTRGQLATSLNTTGMYSVVRHPLYVGNYLMWLGVAIVPRLWWPPVLSSLAFWLYYERIMFAEEEFLRRRFGDAFIRWASVTPAFLPRPSRWRPPAGGFSVRTVLRSEYSSLMALVTSFTVLDVTGDVSDAGRFVLDPVWAVLFGTTTVVYVTILALKRRTRVLQDRVRGRAEALPHRNGSGSPDTGGARL